MNRRIAVQVAAVSVLLVAVAAGWWGLQADRGDHADDEAGRGVAWTPAGDGWVRVTSVTDRTMTAMRMPGMATMPDADPVPDGFTRVSLGVELAAGQEPLRWTPADFVVTGDGTDPLIPHTLDLGDPVLPPGTTIAGGLVYDVPEDAGDLSFAFAGGSALPLADLSRPADDHDDAEELEDPGH